MVRILSKFLDNLSFGTLGFFWIMMIFNISSVTNRGTHPAKTRTKHILLSWIAWLGLIVGLVVIVLGAYGLASIIS